jgi:hypothetical protein
MPFTKGMIANPKGRTKGAISMVKLLKEELETTMEEENVPEEERKTCGQIIVQRFVKEAINGNMQYLVPIVREIIDRTDGKPSQGIDITSQGKQVGTLDAMLLACEVARRSAISLAKPLQIDGEIKMDPVKTEDNDNPPLLSEGEKQL